MNEIIRLMPPHNTYVEVFGGGANVLLAKEPAGVEVYNDIDSGLVNFFRVIRNPDLLPRFKELVSLTPWSREEWTYCRETWAATEDPVDRAHCWFVVARQSFSGTFGKHGWTHAITMIRRGMTGPVSALFSAVERLDLIAARMMMVQVEHMDFRKLIPKYDTPETLFYLDPPYVPDTRSAGAQYQNEMTLSEHADLLLLLLPIKGKAILSGYRNPLYEYLERLSKPWIRRDYPVSSCVSSYGSVERVESLWLSPGIGGEESAESGIDTG